MKPSVFYAHINKAAQQKQCSLDSLLKEVKKLGYFGVDASYEQVMDSSLRLYEQLQEADLAITSVYKFCEFEKNFDSEEMEAFFQRLTEVHCDKAMIIPGFFSSNHTREQDFISMITGVKKTCELGQRYGITVTLENYDDTRSPCFELEDLKRFFDEIPELKWTLDTGNFYASKTDVMTAYEVLKDRLVHVHLKDVSRSAMTSGDGANTMTSIALYPTPTGEGLIPMSVILEQLKQSGYAGYLTVEHFQAVNEWDYIRRSIQWLQCQLNR